MDPNVTSAAEDFTRPGEAAPLERLDPRWISYRRRAGWIEAAVAALVLFGAAWGSNALLHVPLMPALAMATVLSVAVAALAQWWPGVAYRHTSYRLGAHALEVRKGVLRRRVLDVPHSRIQHSDVSQGPIERHFGLATLTVFTAGVRFASVALPGLAHERALSIRERLMRMQDDDVV